jgi:hypothetical protein
MLTFNAAALVALISVIISSIVTVTLNQTNNRFTRESKEEEHRRKRREWFLEKQSRDAEEIIMTFDKFLKEVAEKSGAVQALLFKVALPPLVQVEFSEEAVQTYKLEAFDIGSRFGSITTSHRAWFTYDAVRLTVWFDNFTQKSIGLDSLKNQFRHINALLDGIASDLFFADIKNTKELNAIQEDIDSIKKEYSKLVSDAYHTQRELVQKLWEG